MNTLTLIKPLTLTDRPAVVALKREFRHLDEHEQELKPFGAEAAEEIKRCRRRKAAIAGEIFALRSSTDAAAPSSTPEPAVDPEEEHRLEWEAAIALTRWVGLALLVLGALLVGFFLGMDVAGAMDHILQTNPLIR